MSDAWRDALRHARRGVGASQRELAERAGISVHAVRAYESGKRRPSRAQLTRLLDALKINQVDRNQILSQAGFAADGRFLSPPHEYRVLSRGDAREEIMRYRWPAFVVTDMVEISAANPIAQRLWGFDPEDPALSPVDRNPIARATTPYLIERIVNWDDAAAAQIAAWKGHYRGGESLEHPSAYFAPVVERILAGVPEYVARFTQIWEQTPAGEYPETMRWAYEIDWREPGYGTMRFQCFAWVVNERDGLDIDDWIPLDAESWQVLDRIAADCEGGAASNVRRAERLSHS
jgi:transcriptional regulator with XRE-family HTH domain